MGLGNGENGQFTFLDTISLISFLIGVMKFYHDENIYNIKKKKNIFNDINLPFEFCKKIISYLNSFRLCIKRSI